MVLEPAEPESLGELVEPVPAAPEHLAADCQRADVVELFGVRWTELREARAQAGNVERRVVRNYRVGEQWADFPPNLRESRRALHVLRENPVNLNAPVVEIGLRIYQRIECRDGHAVFDAHKPHCANGAAFAVGGFKIYCREVH